MNESPGMVTYKWQQGVYSLEDLVILVKYNIITQNDFFNITRFKYESVKKRRSDK